MLTPTNFGRCVAVKIGAEKRAITPLSRNIFSSAPVSLPLAQTFQSLPSSTRVGDAGGVPELEEVFSSQSEIKPTPDRTTPDRTWPQYFSEMLHGRDRHGLDGMGGVVVSDLYRENQRRQAPRIAEMQRQYQDDPDGNAPKSFFENFYEWGTTPIGTSRFAKEKNLTHLPRKQQAAAYQKHLDAQHQEATRKGQTLHQQIDRAGDDFVNFVTDPETRTRTMAALGSGSILPAWWPSWAGGTGAEAQRKQIEAAMAVTPADVRLQTELFNETPIAKGVTAGRQAAGTGFKAVRDELGRIGDDLSTPGSTLMGSLGRSGQRIGAAASKIDTGLDPVAWGAQAREQLGWNNPPTNKPQGKPQGSRSVASDASQTVTDYGKKLQELLTDRRYAPLIALPALGLGAYGLYDLLRDKKRRKRPKFYDENAREF